jgi:cytochrome c553
VIHACAHSATLDPATEPCSGPGAQSAKKIEPVTGSANGDIKGQSPWLVWTDLMKQVVEKLTDEDFVSIAAYVSSRTP